MRQIPLGTKGTFTLHVLPEHLANRFKDAMLPQVLATPVMILIMENAALNAIRSFLDFRFAHAVVLFFPGGCAPLNKPKRIKRIAIGSEVSSAVFR
jgi:hypothetical protein